ncbi:MAG: hypothetical protein QM664_09595 [Flavihumibacter sp.]
MLWLESDKDYIRVVTKKTTHIIKQKISAMENLLPLGPFYGYTVPSSFPSAR